MTESSSPNPNIVQKTIIPSDKQKKLDDANTKLTQWANGMPINLSTTGGAEGTIRTAREDMGD